MDRIRSVALVYVRIIEGVGVLVIGIVTAVAILQVFFRYVVGASLFWSEELMRYLTIWGVFLLAGLAYSRGEMMGFTSAVDALPSPVRTAIAAAVRLSMIVFLLVIAWYGFDFAERTGHDFAIALRVSMYWVHLAVPVGCVLLALHIAASFIVAQAAMPLDERGDTGE